MFYIEELKKAAAAIIALLTEAEARIDSPEYLAEIKAQYGENADTFPCRLGNLRGSIMIAKRDLSLITRLAEHAQEESAWPERCAALCEALGIDSDNIEALELMTKDTRYRSECGDLTERIREAAGEIISDAREREWEETHTALAAAGFTPQEDDDDILWQGCRQVTLRCEHNRAHSECWYEFELEVNGVEALRGKSGEFQKLLEAVGIKQEVGN